MPHVCICGTVFGACLCSHLKAHSDRAFIVTSYLGKQWEQHGSHQELIVPTIFIEYSLKLAKVQLFNPTSVETANMAAGNSPLQAYNYEDAHLKETLLTNQSYTRILFSLIIMCLSTVPYMLSDVAYVGGLFLGLFYVVFVWGLGFGWRVSELKTGF